METPSRQSTPLGHHPLLLANDGHKGRQRSGLVPGSSSFPGSQEAGAECTAAGEAVPPLDSQQLTVWALCSQLFAVAREEGNPLPVLPGAGVGVERNRREEEQERSRERLRRGLQRAWGMDAICWNRSAAAAAAPQQRPATAPSSPRCSPPSSPPPTHGPGSTPAPRSLLDPAAPRVWGHQPAPSRPVLSRDAPAHTPWTLLSQRGEGGASNLLHGNGPPAANTVRFTLRHLLVALRVRALPRLEEKRHRCVRAGHGRPKCMVPCPQQAPDQTRPLCSPPGQLSQRTEQPGPHPAPLGTLGTLQPSPPASSPLPPLQAELSSSWQSGAMWPPPPVGHTGHGDRQKWHGMQVEHGWKQERLRQ